jgi:2-methylisocitrate lyase-like PEP mutase family enzyme
MDRSTQIALAQRFRAMHRGPKLLLLPNAWDALSARIFEAVGFDAVATTSGGVAWALGYPDGEQAPWPEIVAATARIARAVRVPVTADIEAGYGATPTDVRASVEEIIDAGAVGINLEDSTPRADMPIRSIDDAAARIRAARDAASATGVPLVINARIDVYSKHIGEEDTRFDETVRRAKAYVAAGADCLYPIGLTDIETVAKLVKAVEAPINIIGRAGIPPVEQWQRIGVARISTATGPTLATISLTRQIADDLRSTGTFDGLKATVTRAELQAMFGPRSRTSG